MTDYNIFIPLNDTRPGWQGYWEKWIEIDMWEASDIVDAQEALL